MAKQYVPEKRGPVTVKSLSSNTISDEYRDKITIAYQYFGAQVPVTDFEWYGKTLDTPIMAGPIGGPIKKPDWRVTYAKAVAEAGSAYWCDFHSPDEWKKILDAGIPAVRVIKPLADMDQILECIAYDTEHGAYGYAMDVDHGMTVYGQIDGQQQPFAPKTAKDLEIIASASPLPFYAKGILSVRDALIAKDAGVTGIIISGHNNRFPCAVPPLKILPEIRKAVGDDFGILVDGGFHTGYDAFKALALGADGILCARDFMAAFSKDGAEGLTTKILQMNAELMGAMANTGSPDLKHINKDAIILP